MTEPRIHTWSLEPREVERHRSRRGSVHGFGRLLPRSTALVVVDMVPFFVDDEPFGLGIVDPVERLAAAVRVHGGTVAWTVPANGPLPPARHEFLGAAVAARYASTAPGGPLRTRVSSLFTVDDDDLVVEKSLPSAFFPGSSDLDAELRTRGVDTVVVCGTVANVCVESTVRDASALGYRPVLVGDAVAAPTDDIVQATVRTIYRSFGDVRTSDEVAGLLAAD